MIEKAFVFQADDERATARLGTAIASTLRTPVLIALEGTLGAGKTRLVQAIATGWNIDPTQVVSPTFGLCAEHVFSTNSDESNKDEATQKDDALHETLSKEEGETRKLFHIDAYRIEDDDQWLELGFDEMILDGEMVIIEWADKFAHLFPSDILNIQIEIVSENQREFSLTSGGRISTEWLSRIEQTCQ